MRSSSAGARRCGARRLRAWPRSMRRASPMRTAACARRSRSSGCRAGRRTKASRSRCPRLGARGLPMRSGTREIPAGEKAAGDRVIFSVRDAANNVFVFVAEYHGRDDRDADPARDDRVFDRGGPACIGGEAAGMTDRWRGCVSSSHRAIRPHCIPYSQQRHRCFHQRPGVGRRHRIAAQLVRPHLRLIACPLRRCDRASQRRHT